MESAPVIKPAATVYRGAITDPERWQKLQPRRGDVIVVTPSKCGTTWTQGIVAMLLHGTTALPDRVTALSPWIDATFTDIDETIEALEQQRGRRVIKTHTPADGFPLWADVKVIAVFRHPLEMFLSLRKHVANMPGREDSPMLQPLDDALSHFLQTPFDPQQVDDDTITTVSRHYEASVLSARLPDPLILNYAAMLRDHAGTVARIDAYLETGRDAKTLAAIVQATAFDAMKANASHFAPEGGRGFWRNDEAFFASGKSGGWRTSFNDSQLVAYAQRFEELLPDPAHREWIESGTGL